MILSPLKMGAYLRESPFLADFLSTCNPFFISKKVALPDRKVAVKKLHLLVGGKL